MSIVVMGNINNTTNVFWFPHNYLCVDLTWGLAYETVLTAADTEAPCF